MDCFDNYHQNNFENNAWKLEEILYRIMQGMVSIITSVLKFRPGDSDLQFVISAFYKSVEAGGRDELIFPAKLLE